MFNVKKIRFRKSADQSLVTGRIIRNWGCSKLIRQIVDPDPRVLTCPPNKIVTTPFGEHYNGVFTPSSNDLLYIVDPYWYEAVDLIYETN